GKVRASAHNCSDLRRHVPKLEPIEKRALQDCVELLGETIAELRTALTDLSPKKSASKHYNDIQTLLSAAMTNEDTCLDGLFYSTKNNLTRYVEDNLHTIAHHVSNSLAMLNKIKRTSVSSSEEVFPEYGAMKNGFPKWLKRRERALLQVPVNETKFDLAVAKDGSGNFTTINEALSAASNSTNTRFVIYIKEGSYFEYVEVDKKKNMIRL
uniref:Probable pectinesterase/pectinesterase inhibitor 39 n=1 Tax=Nicotiana tabacum TaxID=4097 RepID=A0A1S3XAY4_TOBAC